MIDWYIGYIAEFLADQQHRVMHCVTTLNILVKDTYLVVRDPGSLTNAMLGQRDQALFLR